MSDNDLVTSQIIIERPIMEVFEYVADPRHMIDWVPFYDRVTDLRDYDQYNYARTFTAYFSMRPLPPSLPGFDVEVTDLVPGRRIRYCARSLGRIAVCDFRPISGGTALTTSHGFWGWQAVYYGLLVGPLVPAATHLVRQSLQALKDRLEGRDTDPRPKIFFSYRRALSPYVGGRLYDGLVAEFGAGFVFRDVDSLRAGRNWNDDIKEAVGNADVVIVHIPEDWEQEVTRRFSDGTPDFVADELNTALAALKPGVRKGAQLRLIPVLTYDDAHLSRQERWEQVIHGLPEGDLRNSLKSRDIQYVRVRADPEFTTDFALVLDGVWDALRTRDK